MISQKYPLGSWNLGNRCPPPTRIAPGSSGIGLAGSSRRTPPPRSWSKSVSRGLEHRRENTEDANDSTRRAWVRSAEPPVADVEVLVSGRTGQRPRHDSGPPPEPSQVVVRPSIGPTTRVISLSARRPGTHATGSGRRCFCFGAKGLRGGVFACNSGRRPLEEGSASASFDDVIFVQPSTNASMPSHEHTRFRSPNGLSIRLTAGQNFLCWSHGAGHAACVRV